MIDTVHTFWRALNWLSLVMAEVKFGDLNAYCHRPYALGFN